MITLIADIGGTHARFALSDLPGHYRHLQTIKVADYPRLTDATKAYLAALPDGTAPNQGAFAIACPVLGDDVSMTNHHWSFSIQQTEKSLGLDRLDVINDFTALALSLPHLQPGERCKLGGDTEDADFPKVVIGPGTGLGVSALIPTGDNQWKALVTEGGHVTLPTATNRQSEVMAHLRKTMHHVSAEKVLSGPGLVTLYRALHELEGTAFDPTYGPEEISHRALNGLCPCAGEALHMFCALLGTVAGDLALSYGARGGVYIAGGIAPKLGSSFVHSMFRDFFEDKGRFEDYLKPIPCWVITHPNPALLGLSHLPSTK